MDTPETPDTEPAPTDSPATQIPTDEPPREPLNFWLRMTVGSVTLFVITVLIQIAVVLGNPKAPPAIFMDRYGVDLLLGEALIALVLGVLGLTADQRQAAIKAQAEYAAAEAAAQARGSDAPDIPPSESAD